MPAEVTNDDTYSAPLPSEKHLTKKTDVDHDAIELAEMSLKKAKNIDILVKELHKNETEQQELLARKEDLERKEQRNKLKQKQKKWFNRDAASGTIAAGGISALYTGVQYLRNFLPPGIANFIMPFFVLADVGTAVSAWKAALLNRKIIKLKRDNYKTPGSGTWTGSRNKLLRAIFETAWAAVGSAIVAGAIVTSAFMAAATAGAFAAFIAPVFMLVLGTRTIFNAISSGFHLIRSYRNKAKAETLPEGSKERHRLTKQAGDDRRTAKIQAIAASTSAIGFVATTLVMLTHHFSFGFVGVVGGVALGGFMGYLFRLNSQYSSFLKEKHTNINTEMTSTNTKLDARELEHTSKSKQLVGFLPNLIDLVKKAGKFVLPVNVPEDTAPPSPEKAGSRSSYKGIHLKITEGDVSKVKHPEKNPDVAVIKIRSGEHTAKIPVNSDNGAVLTKTRFGIYTLRKAEAEDAQIEHNSLKMGSKA